MDTPRAVKLLRRYVHRALALPVAAVLRPGATYDAVNFGLWERRGIHVTPVNFYSPIPDTRELAGGDGPPSEMPGVDLREEFQLRLMEEGLAQFGPEYNTLPAVPTAPGVFYLRNSTFTGVDPMVYYAMIRYVQPTTIVEVGSGQSTLVGIQACRQGGSVTYLCVDPWPRAFISQGIPGVELVRQKAQSVDLRVFEQLQRNDILFVDSSHVVRTGGEVCFILLEVLPRLAPGVLVHFHDIFLPFDYPREWVVQRHRFWSEQYLLQAYLSQNAHVEVLFGTHFICQTHEDRVRGAFPTALRIGGESFWIRTRG